MVQRLKSILYPPSSSKGAPKADPYQVLDAVAPLLARKFLHNLDPLCFDISAVVSDHFVNRRRDEVELPAIQKIVGEVLGVCYIRAARRQGISSNLPYNHRNTLARTDKVAEAYAQYILNQSVTAANGDADLGRLHTMISMLEESFRFYQQSGSGYRISVPIVAAYIVLRTKLGVNTPCKFRFIWPQASLVLEYIDTYMAERGLTSEEFAEPLDLLYRTNPLPALPATLEELRNKLQRYVKEGREDDVIDTWRQIRDHLGTSRPQTPPSGSLFDEKVRDDVMVEMLQALKATRFGDNPPRNVYDLEQASDELISMVKRPLRREFLHALAANRARVVGGAPEAETGSDVYSLDRHLEGEMPMSRKETALKNLHDIWALANEPGAERDVKLYMLYMEGLGRLGDLKGLQQVWNDLINDKVCKAVFEKDTRESTHATVFIHCCSLLRLTSQQMPHFLQRALSTK
jgi:hypothetical protein